MLLNKVVISELKVKNGKQKILNESKREKYSQTVLI
jgi:hypothetical protein